MAGERSRNLTTRSSSRGALARRREPFRSLRHALAELLRTHAAFHLESIDALIKRSSINTVFSTTRLGRLRKAVWNIATGFGLGTGAR
jgi:hypothetical protein